MTISTVVKIVAQWVGVTFLIKFDNNLGSAMGVARQIEQENLYIAAQNYMV